MEIKKTNFWFFSIARSGCESANLVLSKSALRASHAIMTKKTKAQSTALAKAARDSLEGLSSSEDEDKPMQRSTLVTAATVSPSSSSSASATVTAAASTTNPDRSLRAATQPEAAPLPKS